jgi:hypothetical protein
MVMLSVGQWPGCCITIPINLGLGREDLKCTVLAAPHHGFDNFEKFATVVKPAVVVASSIQIIFARKRLV